MSEVIIEDAGWQAIMDDERLKRARSRLSFHELRLIIDHARSSLPKHRFWGAGEPDCPREIKAGNGELHTLRCKRCGLDNPREELCRPHPKESRP